MSTNILKITALIMLVAIILLAVGGQGPVLASVAMAGTPVGPATANTTAPVTATATLTPTATATATTAAPTKTSVPATPTKTATSAPATPTAIPTAKATATANATNTLTPAPATATRTLVPSTATRTPTKAVTPTKTIAPKQRASAKFAFSSYTTSINLQNLSSTLANITVTYYNPDGTVNTSVPDTIAANSLKFYFPIGATAPFNGSAVVSSDQPIAAVVNVVGSASSSGASGAYDGTAQGSSSVAIPLLMQNNSGYNTWFNVQNTGAILTSVTVNYSDGTSGGPVTIPPGSSTIFNQATESHTANVFAGTVTSSQPVAVAVIEENPVTLFAYTGFANGSTNAVMPLVNANNSGYITGISIQNTGSSPTTVTVSYTPSIAGSACTETQTIPSKQTNVFALYVFAGSPQPGTTTNCAGGSRFVGSAQVTTNSASQPLVVVVNQLLPNVNGEAYGGFNPTSATQKVALPLIMDRNSGYFTGINIMNVGSGTTTVNCTFSGTSYTVSQSLNPGQALTALQNGAIAPGYVGSGTCTAANSGDKIVGVVNELGSGAGQLLVYEGVNE